MDARALMNFNGNCVLFILDIKGTAVYVGVDGGMVDLLRMPSPRFHKEYDTLVKDTNPYTASVSYLNLCFGVTDRARVILERIIRSQDGTVSPTNPKDFKVIKEGRPHNIDTMRGRHWGLLLESENLKAYEAVGGKVKYVDMWVEMGWICML